MKVTRIITIGMIAGCLMGGMYVALPQTVKPHAKETHLRNIRQLTFGGTNAEASRVSGRTGFFRGVRGSDSLLRFGCPLIAIPAPRHPLSIRPN